ncbi:glycosyltransferase family 4 protein [Yeosuana marina]|uniref:glycosyltransferase family 4 protein n=1 Tax=Yeosuana marina TaxID=1565536 RepID=UPI00141DAD09|nr:glycosyltransferase family 4 protein [Yeosuana marina]
MANKYHILFCIPSLASTGGMEKVITAKANYFAEVIGHHVTILISDQNNKPISFPVSKNVTCKDLHIKNMISGGIKGISFLKNIITLRKVYTKEINTLNPDIIIVPERGYEDFIIPYICKHIPKIREYHFSRKASELLEKELPLSTRIKSRLIKQFYFKQFKNYNSLILLTEKDKKEWKHIKNVNVIPNYIESTADGKHAILTRPKKVISVGSMQNDRKGFSNLIRIWSKLNNTNHWTLHIYGDGTYRPVLQKQIEKLNLQDSVFLEGNSNSINQKYQESQLFLFTSKGEGFGMVIVEAQQHGVPAISYDCYCGPSDIIKHNQGGFLIPMNDETAFIKHCELLLNNDRLRKEKSEEAYINAKRFNKENIMPLWDDLFFKLIKQ